ncbi:hypothetical protein F2Q69_00004583 [Brassica cretica]|uniref:Ubiquitin-like protease family profile domain-containing protein n=1 Tax=Brassica cretica TaxID=69181 RepID=A0A8S9NUD4_BRACR|nr:hypothetical protein F2Q69_00004583 [Brassica cretica]
MEMPELPRRIYTLGEEPPAVHSISYHTCWTLHTALKKALHDDEYEELKESKLGVFIKFQELGFDWASRLVHYMLGFQLDIKKKYELWGLVGPEPVRFSLLEFENLTSLNCEYIEDLERPHCVVTKELTSFWEMFGVHVEVGPSTQKIIAAFERCEGWSRDDRKRLAYLAIFTGYIEGRKYSTPTRVSLARLVMELERFENYPWGRVVFKVMMDSVKGEIFRVVTLLMGLRKLSRVINFVQKDIGEMFPKWEFDVEDTPTENIIKLMFVKKLWKWTMDCWEVTGTWVNTKLAVVSPAKKKVVKEDSPRPRKKARKEASEEAAAVASEETAAEASEEVHTTVGGLTKEDIKIMFKDIVDAMREGFGTCLKEIKYLSERVEAMEKQVGITTRRKGTSAQNNTPAPKPTLEPGSESVNGTNAGRKSLPEDKGPDVPAYASSSKDKSPEPSLALCRAKSDRTRKLAVSQQSPYTANSTAKMIIPNKKLYPGYNPFAPIEKKKLKELADWLKTCSHYRTPLDKKPRTSRTWWYQILRTSLEWLEDCHIDAWINVLRKRYDANPQHFRSEKMCFLDHLFAQQWRFNYKDFKDSEPDQNGLGKRLLVNYNDTHWIAMWISIPKRHIVVWNNICSSISPKDLDVHIDVWINVLRKRYDANPQHFRSERMCFLDHLFSQQWRFNFKDFKDSEPDQNGLGRRLLGGAWNYYAGTIPSFCQSNKVWGTNIDDIYAPVNYADTHWIALWISIPKKHIVVFDSICSSISPEELDVPFTYERPNIPPARAGDYGVYTLKYIECHALGIEFSKKDFAKANRKTMRDKMAVDIFQELPDAHEFENKDNDANLGAYEG